MGRSVDCGRWCVTNRGKLRDKKIVDGSLLLHKDDWLAAYRCLLYKWSVRLLSNGTPSAPSKFYTFAFGTVFRVT